LSSGALNGTPAVSTATGSGHSASGSGTAGRGAGGSASGVQGGSGRRAKGATAGAQRATRDGKVGYLLNAPASRPLSVDKSLFVQAVARASGGSGGSVGPLGWILGGAALVAVLMSGALRALEPRARYRRLAA